ncbi:MAG: membrane protein insertase YidC [Chromatiales bacterium]|jgi:YidC/Oxa1 family membrane protein insertase
MDNLRTILFALLAVVLFLLYQAWQEDYGPGSAGGVPATAQQQSTTPDIPAADPSSAVPSPAPMPGEIPASQPATSEGAETSRIVRVRTDVLDLEINTLGGTVVHAELPQMPLSVDNPDVVKELLTTDPYRYYVAESGLIASEDSLAPKHDKAIYTASKTEYKLEEGEDSLTLTLKWDNGKGIEVSKHFTFKRGLYDILVEHEVTNNSGQTWVAREYQQLKRSSYKEETESAFMVFYTGGAVYTDEDKFDKLDFDELAESQLDRDTTGGWVSFLQHYFVSAWIPAQDQRNHLYSKNLGGDRYLLGSYGPGKTLNSGEKARFSSTLYVGPKLNKQLKEVAEGFELTRDYGFLAVIAKPMYWVLETIHDYVGNWGWAIIIFTILLKLIFYKLSETSYRSMAKMKKFTPRIQALKDRYGDDKQRMQQAMMELYKKEKVNPLGGCLPMLIQIPFFIALYWVLMESVELRQAPWILWIEDLSIKDPYFILPLIMGASMFIQQKLNPAPPDPMQAKIMQALPIIFTVFFAFFPAGLVLYWVVNNVLSIAQQYVITKRIEAEDS